jgi:ABC-type transport system involved in multi-copper enzyme maturation permease subunit
MIVLAIALFELKKRLRMVSTWVYFGLLALASGAVAAALCGAFSSVSAGAGSEKVHGNAPEPVFGIITGLALLGLVVVAPIFGQSLNEDIEHNMEAVLFTTPLTRAQHLAGRFFGALVTSTIVLFGCVVGAFIGTHLPSPPLDAATLGDDRVVYYLWPLALAVIPNVIIFGAICFAAIALGRRMFAVYATGIVVVVAYMMSGSLRSTIDHRVLASLLDPFGRSAFAVATQYFSVAEQNTKLMPLTELVLGNRAIWLGVAVVVLGVTYAFFRPGERDGRARSADVGVNLDNAGGAAWRVPTTPDRELGLALRALLARAFASTFKNTYVAIIVVAGLALTALFAWRAGEAFETPVWPVTSVMTTSAGSSLDLLSLVVILFVGGEIVWRERDARMDQIFDALPLPSTLPALAKVAVLLLLTTVLGAVVIVVGPIVQVLKGFPHPDFGLYASNWFLRVLDLAPLAMLSFFMHVMINRKYVAHFVVILLNIAIIWIQSRDVIPAVLLFTSEPELPYSDMNGYGHFLFPVLAFRTYWLAFGLVLVVVGVAFWPRGADTGLRNRLAEARVRLRRGLALPLAGALTVFLALGVALSIQTLVLHKWRTSHDDEVDRADYEKKYKKTETDPQPRVTDVKLDIDIDPATQSLRAAGTLTLTNKTIGPIASVTLVVPVDERLHQEKLTLGGANATTFDDRFGVSTWTLPTPLAPGAAVPVAFDLLFDHHGIAAKAFSTDVVENGTFFHSSSLPSVGYVADAELVNDNDRKKYGLAPRDRMPPVTAPHVRDTNYIGGDADWVTFEATVSTAPDQIALMPGTLEREWTENGRHRFHYVLTSPVLNFFSVVSARYQVKRDRWQDVDLEVDYDPQHPYNVDRMLEGMKDALAYASGHFGPFQHKTLRIVEFPKYAAFAQSFPTIIPFSEAIGFIAHYDDSDEDAVDYPYYVTAHETAHQWWGHQIVGARAQGSTLMSETLAEYTALMVMKQKYGADAMRKFLKQEADGYLRGRSFEQKREVPLVQVENQPYLHYNKGGYVMYMLQDAIGEDAVDRGLASLLAKYRFGGPPYPTAPELVDALLAQAKPEDQPLVHELFESITLFDDHTSAAECTRTADGSLKATLHIAAKKLSYGGLGEEKEVAFDRPVEVGVVDAKGRAIVVEKRPLHAGDQTVELTWPATKEKPARAGVDPFLKLIDRHPEDNTIALTCP